MENVHDGDLEELFEGGIFVEIDAAFKERKNKIVSNVQTGKMVGTCRSRSGFSYYDLMRTVGVKDGWGARRGH